MTPFRYIHSPAPNRSAVRFRRSTAQEADFRLPFAADAGHDRLIYVAHDRIGHAEISFQRTGPRTIGFSVGRVLLRVEGREDFVREWHIGERVTVVRGP